MCSAVFAVVNHINIRLAWEFTKTVLSEQSQFFQGVQLSKFELVMAIGLQISRVFF